RLWRNPATPIHEGIDVEPVRPSICALADYAECETAVVVAAPTRMRRIEDGGCHGVDRQEHGIDSPHRACQTCGTPSLPPVGTLDHPAPLAGPRPRIQGRRSYGRAPHAPSRTLEDT